MTTYDIDRLFQDYFVDYKPANSREWYSIPCPYCSSDSKYKMGIRDQGIAYCWACGSHSFPEVIKILTGQFWHDIRDQYQTDIIETSAIRQERKIQKPSSLSLPTGTGPLNERARIYLKNRGFNPDILAELYGLQSTGMYGNFNFRIIIPIYFNKQLQDLVIEKFSKSLFKNAFLAIGKKESLIFCAHAELFSVIDDENKIYKMDKKA